MPHYGIYRGTCLNNADPQQKARLQVSVPSVVAAQSGWALPCARWSAKEGRTVPVPPPGTAVWVMFENGDPAYPVWMGWSP